MPFDPENSEDLGRLNAATIQSRRQLTVFRTNRKDLLKQYVGNHYSDDGASQSVPINLIELAVNILLRQLAANNPSVLVTTHPRSLRSQAMNLELALNHLFKEIRLVDSLRLFVLEALMSVGIMKTGITSSGSVIEIDGFTHDIGQPFADIISLDDWVHDMRAERWDQISFAGNAYYLPFDLMKESGMFRSEVVDQLKPDTDKYGEADEFGYGGRASDLSQGESDRGDEFQPSIKLWDYWLPHTNHIITVPASDPYKLLRAEEWSGPEAGPYLLLGFSSVPGNIMPLSPLSAGLDLHLITNQLYRKLGRQAERQKDLMTYRGAAHKDAERQRSASDGDTLRVDNPKDVQTISMGGVNANNFVFARHTRDQFKTLLGNLDTLGGLAPQSETLGQDRLIAGAASKRIDDMQDRVIDATTQIVRSLAWYLWNDPLIEIPIVKRIGNRDIATTFTAEDREGDFLDYNIEIEPYSMQHRSPSSRLQGILTYYTQVLLPGQQSMAAEGGRIDFQVLNRLVAKLMNEEAINDIVKFTEQPDAGTATSRERPIQSPVTSRTNLRLNQSATTGRSDEDVLMSELTQGTDKQPQVSAVA